MESKTVIDTTTFTQTILKRYVRWSYVDPVMNPESARPVDFIVIKAINYGVQGRQMPSVTKEGIENIICCSSLIGSQ